MIPIIRKIQEDLHPELDDYKDWNNGFLSPLSQIIDRLFLSLLKANTEKRGNDADVIYTTRGRWVVRYSGEVVPAADSNYFIRANEV